MLGIRRCDSFGAAGTAATTAALNGHTAVLKLLLDRGASPTATDPCGNNAAMMAALGGHADALAILLDRGVDPNAADIDGNTKATHAGRRCRLDVLMLLAVHGVSLQATSANLTCHTARSLDEFGGDHGVPSVRFVDATEGWRPLKVAMACRTPPTRLCAMLASGRIDTAHSTLPDLVATATDPVLLWPGQPPVLAGADTFTELRALLRLAVAPWSPLTHSLHRLRFRQAVRTAMLASARLRSVGKQRRSARRAINRHPPLPTELWLLVLGSLPRRDWQAGSDTDTHTSDGEDVTVHFDTPGREQQFIPFSCPA